MNLSKKFTFIFFNFLQPLMSLTVKVIYLDSTVLQPEAKSLRLIWLRDLKKEKYGAGTDQKSATLLEIILEVFLVLPPPPFPPA